MVVDQLERYYASFPNSKRHKFRTDDCATLGSASAPIAVVEFSDYQCPHCATAVKPLQQMVERSNGAVRLCSKYFPLQQHPRAAVAAAVAEYARGKGKFWQMNDLLFENQEQLDDANLKAFGRKLGLNADEMLKQAYAGKFDPVIEAHKAEGNAAGIRATPSIYVNGRLFTLPHKLDYLLFTVDDELEWQRAGGWEKD
jgi:protein-disulfide isomerase